MGASRKDSISPYTRRNQNASMLNRLFPIALAILIVARTAAAADCAHYRVLVQAGAFEDFETTLERDTKNRACALHLALAYDEEGDARRAVQWINYARLFANAELDPEIYPEILFRKLLWDPDSASEERGYPVVRDYDPQRDLDRLEGLRPSRAAELRDAARSRLEDQVSSYLGSPWGKSCPSRQGFWDSQVQDVASRVHGICRAVETWEDLTGRPQSRATVDGALGALAEIARLGVEIRGRDLPFRDMKEYYQLEAEARMQKLSSQRRAELLGDAFRALERAKGQDTEDVDDRRRQYLLMADIERELDKNRGRPFPDAVEEWRYRDRRLPPSYSLPDDYRLALDLLDSHQACLDAPKLISTRHPCRLFIEDKRWKDVSFAKNTLERLRGEGRQILKSRIVNSLDVFEEFLTVENPRNLDSGSLLDTLYFFRDLYSEQLDGNRLEHLIEMARIDRDLHAFTEHRSNRETANTSLFKLKQQATADVHPVYEGVLSLVATYAACREDDSELPIETDACRELLDSPKWSAKVRRRNDMKALRAEAGKIVEKRIEKAILEINKIRDAKEGITDKGETEAEKLSRILESEYSNHLKPELLAALKNRTSSDTTDFVDSDTELADSDTGDNRVSQWPVSRLDWRNLVAILAAIFIALLPTTLVLLLNRGQKGRENTDSRGLAELPHEYEASGLQISSFLQVPSPPSSTLYGLIERSDGTYGIYLVEVNKFHPRASQNAHRLKRPLMSVYAAQEHREASEHFYRAVDLLSDKGIEAAICILEINPRNMTVSCASNGVPPLIILRSGVTDPIRWNTFIARRRDTGATKRPDNLPLEDGDILLLVSNGVPDAKDAHGRVFGLQKLLEVTTAKTGPPSRILEACLDSLKRHTAGEALDVIQKDRTLIVCRVRNVLVSKSLDEGIPVLELNYDLVSAPQLAEQGLLSKMLIDEYRKLTEKYTSSLRTDDCILCLEATGPDTSLAKMLEELLSAFRERRAILVCIGDPRVDFTWCLETRRLTEAEGFIWLNGFDEAKKYILGRLTASNGALTPRPEPTDTKDELIL